MEKGNGLKIRAQRLRSSIKAMLGLDISVSQSLELVAKEENYPNWDAASACFANTSNDKKTRRFLQADEVQIFMPYLLISGHTASGKTTVARCFANRLAQKGGKSVAVISTIRELESSAFLSPTDPQFKEQLARVNLSETVLLIDDPDMFPGSTKDWLELALQAAAAVVTLHTKTVEREISQGLQGFQQVDCDTHKCKFL